MYKVLKECGLSLRVKNLLMDIHLECPSSFQSLQRKPRARRVISTRLFQTVGFSPPREFYKVIFFNNIGRSGFAPQEIEQNSKVNIDVHAL